jgi:hypothetical protein
MRNNNFLKSQKLFGAVNSKGQWIMLDFGSTFGKGSNFKIMEEGSCKKIDSYEWLFVWAVNGRTE